MIDTDGYNVWLKSISKTQYQEKEAYIKGHTRYKPNKSTKLYFELRTITVEVYWHIPLDHIIFQTK